MDNNSNITTVEGELNEQLKISLAYATADNLSISTDETERLYNEQREKIEAILFTGTTNSANQVILFTEGKSYYTQTIKTIETNEVEIVYLTNGERALKNYYVIKNLINTDRSISAFSAMKKESLELYATSTNKEIQTVKSWAQNRKEE